MIPRGKTSRRLAVIGGLSAIAIVAPILDLYGKNPEVFVANRSTAVEIVIFALGLALLVPLLAWGLLAVAELAGVSKRTYQVMVAMLSLAAGLVVSRQVFPDSTVAAIAAALVVAAGIYWLARNIETVFVFASVAVPVLVVMFLSTSATARLIWSEPEVEQSATEVGSPSHLVMIQLDEMPLASIVERDGSINERLFPGFARLAEEGTWYRNALSDSIATTQSVPAILTGRREEPGLSPSYVDHPNNLFTLLADSHEMHVIEWVAELCPKEICPDYAGRAPARFTNLVKDVGVVYGHLTLPKAGRELLPSIDNAWKGFLGQSEDKSGTAVEIPDLPVPPSPPRVEWADWIQRLINGIHPRSGPTLSYAHLQAPHVPWVTNPSGTHYQRPEDSIEVAGVEGDGRWGADPDPALIGFQRHLYQVGFLDTMLGRLLDQIEDSGTWEETMVIVVADHGASFVPGEHRRWPFENNRDDLYRVPLFVKYPGQVEGETVDLPVFGIDILPTVVDVMNIGTDWGFDGISLLDLAIQREHEPIRWCCNGEGASTDLDVLYQQVERNHRWIPDQTSWTGVAAIGPNAGLVGRSLTDLDIRSGDSFRWSLQLGSDLGEVGPNEGLVQTVITGRVEAAEMPDDEQLLVVINERVAGVADLSQDSASGGSIYGLISEDFVAEGRNEIQLLASDGNGGWMSGVNDDITLELIAPDGHRIEVGAEGKRRVQVDEVEMTADGWMVKGWAADVVDKLTADAIYVFVGDRLLAQGPPDVDNRNVVGWFESEDLLTSGFRLDVAGEDIPAGVDRLLVVAEFGDQAVADTVALPVSGG